MNAPDPPNWTLKSCFGAFHSFWCICNVSLLHETQCKMGWTGATKEQVCAMKSHRKFFATNAPDPPHWTINSWYGAFHSVWVHFGLFRYCTKVDAKRAEMVELMHKFVPWSRVRIFKTNAPDPPNWSLNSCFCVFRSVLCIWQSFVNRRNPMQKGLKWCN